MEKRTVKVCQFRKQLEKKTALLFYLPHSNVVLALNYARICPNYARIMLDACSS